MTGIGTNIIAFVVAIGVLVAFHEFGHFWVARRLGVKVLRFSIGFGKPLYTWVGGRDRVEYCLSAIPLGGYVKMLDGREGVVPEQDRHRAFNVQPLWRRTAIVAAGPAFNFIFAILVYWLIFVAGTAEVRPVVGDVMPDTPAAEAGLESGDEFFAVDGNRTPSWERVLIALLDGGMRQDLVEVTVRSDDGGETVRRLDLRGVPTFGDDPDLLRAIGFAPWRPSLPPVIGELVSGGAAEQGDLRAGERIIAVDGESVDAWPELVEAVNARAGGEVVLTVRGAGGVRRVNVRLAEAGSPRGVLGVRPEVPEGLYEEMYHTVRYGPMESVGQALQGTWQASKLTLQVLWRMVIGQASLQNLSGPINIAQYAGDTASSGIAPFLKFLAIVSISLGVLNLLPIPVLDGGHLFYFLVEAVKGSPPSERFQAIGQQIGMLLLLMLMSLALYNDIARMVS
ncbi:MAG: RIP metalloprotease RseP [Aquisalimonadaceae bacterium]